MLSLRRMVFITARIQFHATGAATHPNLTGLPFAGSSASGHVGGGVSLGHTVSN